MDAAPPGKTGAVIYQQEALLPWVRAALDHVGGVELFDAHVHVGISDPAGLNATEAEAIAALEQVGSRALVFPLKEPGGYRAANERVCALAEREPRFRALARLDPDDDPLDELVRARADGAVGLKLHPRGEGFDLEHPALVDVFELADEQRLPIMVHAGVGDVDIGPQAVALCQRHPGLRIVLAHCAIGAFDQVVRHTDDLPNLFFDTSWWNPSDVWALFRTVRPGQVLFASDIPFANPALAILMTARLGVQAGLTGEQLRAVMGGQLERLVAHEDPLDVGPFPADHVPLAPELERLYVTLCSAVEPLLRGEAPGQGIDLVRAAVADPVGDHADVIRSIGELLELYDGVEEGDALRPLRAPGFDLVLSAAILARTPAAMLP
ncbi:amidohydrolase family protein [Conexibacter sp. SYSU D00693]|uniref:amidohydrolase family protein n=1 Tax=Conexibacter sp. SYSU D00693 TaxID=2812560 RepID=UPI00196B522D|nr:amidohydrolase family protein [Conexibacter sp. SYSU D00693]